jgi:hypothetical protein
MEQERKYAYQIIQITQDRSKPLSQIILEVEEKVREIMHISITQTTDAGNNNAK